MNARRLEDRRARREAIERLLDWGFSPAVIAVQLGCSAAWIYRVRRERRGRGAEVKRSSRVKGRPEG